MDAASVAIDALPAVLPVIESPVQFMTHEWDLELFDSAEDGSHLSAPARASASPSTFSVTTEKYQSQGQFEFLVHRFLRS
jgi:hypothetical protein